MIMNAHHGYSKSPKVKHPELNDVKAGDPLLVVKFTEEDILRNYGDSVFESFDRAALFGIKLPDDAIIEVKYYQNEDTRKPDRN